MENPNELLSNLNLAFDWEKYGRNLHPCSLWQIPHKFPGSQECMRLRVLLWNNFEDTGFENYDHNDENCDLTLAMDGN